jgi:hypothetical protein
MTLIAPLEVSNDRTTLPARIQAAAAYPNPGRGRSHDMCIYCQEHEVSEAVELCPRCAFAFQVEVAEGLYRLGRYLSSWAAFDEWLSGRRREAAPA